jgi:flagellar M-ring protein FliF
MNRNLSQLGSQLLATWKQLGLNQRISLVLASSVVIGGVIALMAWSGRADYALLYGKLSDTEAARVVSALDDTKTPYKATGGSIYVPADKVHLLRMQLAGKGIPRGEGVGFEIFDKPNFGISDFVQRANYIRAIQGELSRTVSQLDEIEQARVMVVLPENRLLVDKDRHPTASVFVRVRGNSVLPAQSVNSIRFLVANAVEGLKPGYVSVVDNQGNVLSENGDDDSITGISSAQFGARRNLEQYLAKKVEGMLEKVLGPGQAIVRVAAEVNYDTTSTVEEKFDPEGQVIRSETKNDENVDTSHSAAGEVVGTAANTSALTNAPSANNPVNSVRNQKAVTKVEYDVSKTTSNTFRGGGGVKRISAAVSVAARYEGTGSARKPAPRTPEDLEKLRRMVAGALGADTVRGDLVSLEELPFNTDVATEITRQFQQDEKWQYWLAAARSLGYPALALAVMIFLVRLMKRTPVDQIPIGIPLAQFAGRRGNGNGNGHGNGRGNGHDLDWLKPPQREAVSVEVLNQLVKENPGNMTQAIRNWMATSATPETPRNDAS